MSDSEINGGDGRLWLPGPRILGGLHIERFDDEIALCIIWAGMIIASIWFAVDAYQLSLAKLGTFDFRIPPEYNVNINGVKFQKVINSIAQTQDHNAKALQAAIKNRTGRAKTTIVWAATQAPSAPVPAPR